MQPSAVVSGVLSTGQLSSTAVLDPATGRGQRGLHRHDGGPAAAVLARHGQRVQHRATCAALAAGETGVTTLTNLNLGTAGTARAPPRRTPC